jgi:hypothetical protein
MDDPIAATALGELAESENVIRILHLLPAIIPDKESCRKRLMDYLRHESEHIVRLALLGLIELGTSPLDSEVVSAALATFGGRVPCGVSFAGVRDLISWAPQDPSVRELAIHQIKNRGGEIGIVARSYGQDADLRRLILAQLNPLPSNLRLMLVDRLAPMAPEDDFAHQLLKEFDEDVDERVKTASAIGYAKSVQRRGASSDLLVDQLSKMLHAGGLDHAGRSQAAFAGLLELNRMDVIDAEKDALKYMDVSEAGLVNFRLASHLAKYWDRVQSSFGMTFWNHIGYAPDEFLEELAREIFDDEFIETLLAMVRKNKGQTMSLIELRVRSKQWQGTDRLRQICLELVTNFWPSDWNQAAPGILAAEILSEQYTHDHKVYDQLLAESGEVGNASALVVALCGAWPQSDVLIGIRDDPKQRLMTPSKAHLFCRFTPNPKFLELLGSMLRNLTGEIWDFLPTCIRALELRFKRDGDVRDGAFLRLEAGASPAEKCNLTQLLRCSDNRLDRLRAWARAELVRQHGGQQLPESALDIYTGRVRPIAEVARDLILS